MKIIKDLLDKNALVAGISAVGIKNKFVQQAGLAIGIVALCVGLAGPAASIVVFELGSLQLEKQKQIDVTKLTS